MDDSSVHRYRSIPVVSNNPEWWMLEIFDGFGAHLNNLVALKKRVINKILSLKEEADFSSYTQAYNQAVAKSDKSIHRMNLSYLCQDSQYCKNIIG